MRQKSKVIDLKDYSNDFRQKMQVYSKPKFYAIFENEIRKGTQILLPI